MPVAEQYRRQAALLIRVLPFVAEEACFALKGGRHQSLWEWALGISTLDDQSRGDISGGD